MTTSINYWPDPRCAKAFWNQHELPPYQELLRDTTDWLEPTVGQRWLDLGCGSGQLSRVLWEKSGGKVESITGVDVASINDAAFAHLRQTLQPTPTRACLRFIEADFSSGFPEWPDAQFDGVVSGLSLQYADSFCEDEGCWTQSAYDHVLAEVHRLLRPAGVFVFSVNVPDPSWTKVAWESLTGTVARKDPVRYLKQSWRMWTYGSWLTRESKRGRFHYLPLETIIDKLHTLGFQAIEHRLSYAGQAYVIRCQK